MQLPRLYLLATTAFQLLLHVDDWRRLLFGGPAVCLMSLQLQPVLSMFGFECVGLRSMQNLLCSYHVNNPALEVQEWSDQLPGWVSRLGNLFAKKLYLAEVSSIAKGSSRRFW